MSPSLPTPAFQLYILNILLSPTLPNFPFFQNCHATPKGHGLPPPQNSERAPDKSHHVNLELHDTIYRLRFYSNLFIHISLPRNLHSAAG